MDEISWTVVITTKNRCGLLRRAIQSALGQTLACEIVVVDDGSTDETSGLAVAYPTVKFLRNQVSVGHSAAANQGIWAAGGSWIKPLDDDDYLHPSCLEVMTSAVAAAPNAREPVLVTSLAVNVDVKGTVVSRSPPALPSQEVVTLDSATLLRLMMLDQAAIGAPVQVGHHRQTAIECGGWNEKNLVCYADDTEFWIRLAHRGGAVFVPEELGYRTVWDGNNSSKLSALERYNALMALKSQIGIVPQSVRSGLALRLAMSSMRAKDVWSTFSLLGRYATYPLGALHLLRQRTREDAKSAIGAVG